MMLFLKKTPSQKCDNCHNDDDDDFLNFTLFSIFLGLTRKLRDDNLFHHLTFLLFSRSLSMIFLATQRDACNTRKAFLHSLSPKLILVYCKGHSLFLLRARSFSIELACLLKMADENCQAVKLIIMPMERAGAE